MIATKFFVSNCTNVSPRMHCVIRKNSGGHWLNKKGREAVAKTAKENAAPLHKTTVTQYPAAAPLPLPTNVEEFEASEKARFSPQRARDISGPVITAKAVPINWNKSGNKETINGSDPHVVSYDCRGAVSLSSVMQTNVPEPFSPSCKSTYLNMPGGQWGQCDKYIAEDLRNSLFSHSSTDTTDKLKKNGDSVD